MQTCSTSTLLQGDGAGLDLQVEIVTIQRTREEPQSPKPYLSTASFPWISYRPTCAGLQREQTIKIKITLLK